MADRHLGRALRRVPLFSELGRRELAAAALLMGERRIPAGTEILTQGDIGVGFFAISSGRVDVIVDGRHAHSFGPGDHFGDFALLAESARTATVVAATDVHCFTLTSWDFRRLVETNPTVSRRVTAAMERRLLGAPGETEHPPTPGEEKMKSRGPMLTMVAMVSLALALLGINVAAKPVPAPTPAAASAPATPPVPPPTSVAPTTVAEVQPPPAAFPAEAAYAGRTSGNELTVAVAVKAGRAVAYVCDGKKIEAWLEGTVDGSRFTLTGADGTTLTGELVNDALFGQVDRAGKQWPYAAKIATTPAGSYRGQVSVRGVQKRIGWNVLQDGTVTGLSSDGTPAPQLDVAAGTATLDGAPVVVVPISGNDDVTG